MEEVASADDETIFICVVTEVVVEDHFARELQERLSRHNKPNLTEDGKPVHDLLSEVQQNAVQAENVVVMLVASGPASALSMFGSLASDFCRRVPDNIRRGEGEDHSLKRVALCMSDIANACNKSFGEKVQWFHETCTQLHVEWGDGHVRMHVRRRSLLEDSDAVMALSREHFQKLWRFKFIDGEEGVDAGGLAREWFQFITERCFDPYEGLWQSNAGNRMSMQLNPSVR